MKSDYVSVGQIIEFARDADNARKLGNFRKRLDAIIADNHHPIEPGIDSVLKFLPVNEQLQNRLTPFLLT